MSAKLSAQIDTGVNLVVITRAPAATSSPAIVSSSGRPGSHQAPEGDDQDDDRHRPRQHLRPSMADRLAVLKSAHRALSPVRVTVMPDDDRAASLRLDGVGGLHHLVGVRSGSGGDDGGPAVTRDRDPGLGWDHGGYPGIAAEHVGRLGHDDLGLGVRRDRTVVVDDDHLEPGGTEPREVLLDDGPCRDGLAVGGLPPGAGERALDVDGEDSEDDEHQQPCDEDSPASFTHGESSTLGVTTTELGQVRAAELADAASELGVDHVELFDYPDGALNRQPIDRLAKHVCQMADRVRPDLLLVFDEGGVTGHLDHGRATEAALEFARDTRLPVLAWAVAQPVATTLNEEFGTTFVGRTPVDLDFEVHVDRGRQRRAIIRHASQATDNPVLLRRLKVQGDREVLRWLVAPSEGSPIGARTIASV